MRVVEALLRWPPAACFSARATQIVGGSAETYTLLRRWKESIIASLISYVKKKATLTIDTNVLRYSGQEHEVHPYQADEMR